MSDYLNSFQKAKAVNHNCRVSLQNLALSFEQTGNETVAYKLQQIGDQLEESSRLIGEGVKLQLDERSLETYTGMGNILTSLLTVSEKSKTDLKSV